MMMPRKYRPRKGRRMSLPRPRSWKPWKPSTAKAAARLIPPHRRPPRFDASNSMHSSSRSHMSQWVYAYHCACIVRTQCRGTPVIMWNEASPHGAGGLLALGKCGSLFCFSVLLSKTAMYVRLSTLFNILSGTLAGLHCTFFEH